MKIFLHHQWLNFTIILSCTKVKRIDVTFSKKSDEGACYQTRIFHAEKLLHSFMKLPASKEWQEHL
jgi:hypothetical protein